MPAAPEAARARKRMLEVCDEKGGNDIRGDGIRRAHTPATPKVTKWARTTNSATALVFAIERLQERRTVHKM